MSFNVDISTLGTYVGQTISSLSTILLTVLGLVVGFGLVRAIPGLFRRATGAAK